MFNFEFIKFQEVTVLRHFYDLKSLINLKWVSFERIYNDGYMCVMSSNAEIYKSHFNAEEIFVHPAEREEIKNNIYKNLSLLGKCIINRDLSEMKLLGCSSHFILIFYHKEYQDVFRFCMQSSSPKEIGKTINHLQLIEHLAFKFIARYRSFIDTECSYFLLPKQMQGTLKSKYFIPNVVLWNNLKTSTQITAREFYVLLLYIRGKPHKQIGEILGVKSATSERYLENIKNKLQIHSRKELKALACENWLI